MLSSFAAGAEATPVHIGMHVVQLRAVDARTESFYADLYLWLRFPVGDEARAKEIVEKLEPVNGKFDSKDLVDDKVIGTERYICYRVTGTFFFVPDLKNYPFDTQVLPITVENAQLELEEMTFVDDKISYEKSGAPELRWGLSPTLSIPDYTLARVDRDIYESKYPTSFGDPTRNPAGTHYSRYTLKVSFVREYWSYAFKILIPLLIILLMAYLVFFLPPNQLDTAASVAMTALLSCMAYNVAVSQNMPEIGYLVLSDKFFIATYVLLFLTLAQTFIAFILDGNGKPEAALKLDLASRWIFPVLVTVIFAGFIASV
ncbi:MAG: hypothetical protein Q8N23_13705 [Archangium sp.]|nr:hypothetical protein [Archangium sp.]MDP3569223.1 hypothetical protein [Archangium sp.]